jgi:hypothetical protein
MDIESSRYIYAVREPSSPMVTGDSNMRLNKED